METLSMCKDIGTHHAGVSKANLLFAAPTTNILGEKTPIRILYGFLSAIEMVEAVMAEESECTTFYSNRS